MKVTIITVCYNSVSTIEKTFLSVKMQTYSNLEYIVIDGNSNDGTIDLITKYISIIDVCISESDQGLYDAMNKGIAMASGDLVGILNSDDIFQTNTVIEEIVDFHKKNNIKASIGDVIQVNDKDKVVRLYSSKNWKPEKLAMGFMPPHPSIFFKRELFGIFGNYNLEFKIGSDFELIARFFLKNNIKWKYSGIVTTSMLIGGLSSSGFSSYSLISYEICKAMRMNGIPYSSIRIKTRILWKIIEFLKRAEFKD